jgi:hypothetical protein
VYGKKIKLIPIREIYTVPVSVYIVYESQLPPKPIIASRQVLTEVYVLPLFSGELICHCDIMYVAS